MDNGHNRQVPASVSDCVWPAVIILVVALLPYHNYHIYLLSIETESVKIKNKNHKTKDFPFQNKQKEQEVDS